MKKQNTLNLLTRHEAAELLTVCPRTMDKLINNGEIPVLRIYKTVRIRLVDLENYVRNRTSYQKKGGKQGDGSGSVEDVEPLNRVLARIVGESELKNPPVLTPESILKHAKNSGALEMIVSNAQDPRKSLGHKLKRLKGRILMDSKKRSYQFNRRTVASGANYPVRFLNH